MLPAWTLDKYWRAWCVHVVCIVYKWTMQDPQITKGWNLRGSEGKMGVFIRNACHSHVHIIRFISALFLFHDV